MQKTVLNYRIIIEKEKYEDGSSVYVAQCPTLNISDYADTIEGVLASIKDGIELAVELLVKEGKEVPLDHVEEQIITSAKITLPANIKVSLTWMSKLPRNVKGKQLVSLLQQLGFQIVGKRGSHIRLSHPDGRWTQVAVHPKPIPQGTLRTILRQAEISVDELVKLL